MRVTGPWKFRTIVQLMTGCAVLAFPSGVHAQAQSGQATENEALQGTEILVTAQRREQSAKDVPISISVVSGKAIEALDLRSLEGITNRLPNVRISSGPLTNQLVIRGVGSGQNPGFEQSVATFVDGAYRSRSRSSDAALFDIERLEVLKGPQITFFGANAIAGALNIATRKPSQNAAVNLLATASAGDGGYSLEAAITQPLTSNLSARIAGRASGMAGYIDLPSGEKGPRNRTYLGRVSLRWEPTANFRSDLRVDYNKSTTRNASAFVVTDCPPLAQFPISPVNPCARFLAIEPGAQTAKLGSRSYAPPTDARLRMFETVWSNSLEIGGGTLSSITGYLDQTSGNRTNVIPFPIAGAVNGFDPLPVELEEKFRQFSQEVRYTSKVGGMFEYMVGGYFSDTDLRNTQYAGFYFLPFGAFNPTGSTGPTTPITAFINVGEKAQTLSAFGAATFRPVEALRINVGVRYSRIRKVADRFNVFGTANNAEPTSFLPLPAADQPIFGAIIGANFSPFATPRRVDTKFMPSVGVQYDVTSAVMAYASYSAGFKAGGYGATSQPDVFAPENVDAFELGIKGDLADRLISFNLALFLSNYNDLQEAVVAFSQSGSVENVVRNAASARSKGIELGLKLRPAANLSITADLAYLDSKYLRFPNGTCTQLANAADPLCVQDLSGKRRAFAPRFSGNIGAELTIPVGGGQIAIAPNAYSSSAFFQTSTADPLLQQNGFAKVDLRLGYVTPDRRWTFSVIGKNLTDRTTAGFRQPITLAFGSTSALLDPPRTVAFQLNYQF